MGVSPTVITRAVVEMFDLPVYVFNAGLVASPSVDIIDLGGEAAQCVTTGKALPLGVVMNLYERGLQWGETLAHKANGGYLILSECVVAGTTNGFGGVNGAGYGCAGNGE